MQIGKRADVKTVTELAFALVFMRTLQVSECGIHQKFHVLSAVSRSASFDHRRS
jgi:hypothetical protein